MENVLGQIRCSQLVIQDIHANIYLFIYILGTYRGYIHVHMSLLISVYVGCVCTLYNIPEYCTYSTNCMLPNQINNIAKVVMRSDQ